MDKHIKLLFIGNSATYVHDIPETLALLAGKAGYCIETKRIVKGGYRLSQHADLNTERGRMVFDEIARGYNIVFLQDNGNCVLSAETREATKNACAALDTAIRASGAETCFYVRPPYGYDSFGYTPFEQCIEFDKLFGEIADKIGAKNVYVNRAFAYAMKHLPYNLWGPDNAHTSEYGAYLAVCLFFATLFNTTSTVLEPHDLPPEEALELQKVADKIVLDRWKFD